MLRKKKSTCWHFLKYNYSSSELWTNIIILPESFEVSTVSEEFQRELLNGLATKKRHPFTVKRFWRREPLSVGTTKFLFQVRLCIQNSSVPKTEKPILLLSLNKWFLSNIGSLWRIISVGPGFQFYSISFELSSRRNTEPIEGTTASCIKINFYLYHFPVRLSFLFKLKVANAA